MLATFSFGQEGQHFFFAWGKHLFVQLMVCFRQYGLTGAVVNDLSGDFVLGFKEWSVEAEAQPNASSGGGFPIEAAMEYGDGAGIGRAEMKRTYHIIIGAF